MNEIAKTMTGLLMIMICLLGYAAAILGFIFVIDVAAKELLGIDLLARFRKWSSRKTR